MRLMNSPCDSICNVPFMNMVTKVRNVPITITKIENNEIITMYRDEKEDFVILASEAKYSRIATDFLWTLGCIFTGYCFGKWI